MGEAAARKVTEIDEVRQRLDMDLRELEERLPAPVRSAKAVLGVVLGTAVLGLLARRVVSGRSDRKPAAEVVVRIVREDR
ncbi:MAG TPA: hypothetical protein VFT27_02750 [Actinomycetota bacterium]|nr:hypothetical protein [Actinomycetota bacterium]